MRLPDGPVFVSRLPSDVTGVDFLGVAAVNENLVGLCFPGISTYTRYLRVYSAMSWMAWRFTEYVRQEAAHKAISEKELAVHFRRFREKVEILFTLGNPGYPEIAGSTRRDHVPKDNQRFPLEFDSLGKMAISWLDAAIYGPSLHTLSGLGFLERARGNAHRPTASGIEMALALDAVLQKSPYYSDLADIERNVGTREFAVDIGKRWAVRQSTVKERIHFKQAFFPSDAGDEGANNLPANRVAMGKLICRTIHALGGRATEEDVRRTITRGVTSRGKAVDLSACERTQGIWAVLQLRQLQRVAHEALLRWLEVTLLQPPNELRGRSSSALANLAASQAAAYFEVSETEPIETVLRKVRLKEGADDYFLAGISNPQLDPFEVLAELLLVAKEGDNSDLPGAALIALALCAAEAKVLMSKEHHARWVGAGGTYRLSLRALVDMFDAYRGETVGAFAGFLIESCVIGQHLKVTNGKGIEPNKNKFRFMPLEEGIRLFIRPDQRTSLGVTGDRLQNAMELMTDCAVLRRDKNSAQYSVEDGV